MKGLKLGVVLVAAALALVAFTGCPTSGPVELTLGIWPNDTAPDEVKLHEGYKATFEAAHEGSTIKPASYTYALDTFPPMAEAGKTPALFQTWFTEPQKLINNGWVRDITDILKKRGWLDTMNPAIKDLLSKDGRTYGVPRDGYVLGMFLNLNLFDAAGLVNADGTVNYPKTWKDVAEMGKKIKDATGKAGICILAADNAGGWHFSNIAWNFGAPLVSQAADGTVTSELNSSAAIAAMEYIKSLKWDYNILTADPTSEGWGTGHAAVGTGLAAMEIAANDAVNQPTETNGLAVDKLSLIPMPAGPNGDQFMLLGGTPYMFAANATDAQVEAGLDYLEIMGRGPVATAEAKAGMEANYQYQKNAGIPVIPRFPMWIKDDVIAMENEVIAKYSNVNMALYQDYFTMAKKAGVLHAESPGDTQSMYAELTKVLQAVVTDKNADVKALMDTADANYQTILDNDYNMKVK